MPTYSVRDVEKVLRLSRSTIRGLIALGFVKPVRGARREYRFSFQDLIVLRAARALIQAKIPRRRIRRSLESLREGLPETMPLSGLSISAVGDRVVVRNGDSRWQADDGQYLLGLDVTVQNGLLCVVEHQAQASVAPAGPACGAGPAKSSDDWFTEALEAEAHDTAAACRAYEKAVTADAGNLAAWTNWGRLLHAEGQTQAADTVYRRALERCGPDPLLMFNLGVLLEDLGDRAAALEAYQHAIVEDPLLADCHYNLARLYEALGKQQHAIRHLGQYRRLTSDSR
ncbi:MAG TPA: tetratricopeptide repeat protein [Steroidobacteraceae bacterium]|nr:tetratricopeptide repeat protein [Steroidobacteraceae bacterium]